MSDLVVPSSPDYGTLLSSYGNSLANQTNASTGQMTAQAQLPQIKANTSFLQSEAYKTNVEAQYKQQQLQALQGFTKALAAVQAAQAARAQQGGGQQGLPDTPGSTEPGAPFDEDAARARMAQKFSDQYRPHVAPYPEEYQLQQVGNMYEPLVPGIKAVAQDAYQNRVNKDTLDSQTNARNSYDIKDAIARAPEGAKFQTWFNAEPGAATGYAQHLGLDPKKSSEWSASDKAAVEDHVAKYATMAQNELFQYTKDEMKENNGQLINDRTKLPAIGDQVLNMSPEQRAQLYKDGAQPVTWKNNQNQEVSGLEYKRLGFDTNDQYVAARIAASKTGNQGGQLNPAPTASGVSPTKGASPRATAASTTPAVPANPTPTATPVQATATPKATQEQGLSSPSYSTDLQSALNDKKYQSTFGATGSGFAGPTIKSKGAQEAEVEQTKAAPAEAQKIIVNASRAKAYIQAAQEILNSPNPPTTGLPGQIWNEFAKVWNGDQATKYAQLSKYLANQALVGVKDSFGKNLAQKEVQLQLTELSPSETMPPQAIKALLEKQGRMVDYAMQMGSRMGDYFDPSHNMNGTKFWDWNQSHFPLETYVNSKTAQSNSSSNSSANSTPLTNSKGWALHTDAKGKKAYVSPDKTKWEAP